MKIRPSALGIVRKDDYILVSKHVDNVTNQTFHRLFGGGIEFGEKSIEAIKREFLEELGVVIVNEKFLCAVENIFIYNGEQGHEITFLYEVDFEDKDLYKVERIKRIDHDNQYGEWIPVEEIKNGKLIVYPKETINYL